MWVYTHTPQIKFYRKWSVVRNLKWWGGREKITRIIKEYFTPIQSNKETKQTDSSERRKQEKSTLLEIGIIIPILQIKYKKCKQLVKKSTDDPSTQVRTVWVHADF